MRVDDHLAALRREGELMAEAVAATEWDAPVPTCPDWTVRELTHHLGRVHRWAANVVRERRDGPPDEETEAERIWGHMPDDAAALHWYRAGHAALLATLAGAPEDLVCWGFLPAPSPRAFWARRQAHETAIHRADAQAATGPVDGVEPDFAVDGIDELLLGFYSRPRNRVRSEVPRSLAVTAEDAEAYWIIHFGPEGVRPERTDPPGANANAKADGEVRGSASDLYLALWNRRPLEALRTAGDPALVELWRARAHVRWT